jgi:hypothetical protein
MKRRIHLLIGAVSALAVAALPLKLESLAFGSLEPASAFAKNGNGGNGNGGGNGKGGGGKGHSGEHGKSTERGKSGGGLGLGSGRLKSIFGAEARGEKGKKATQTKVAKAKASKKSARAVDVAALPDLVPVPVAKPKEKKLNARLAGLNSLKRNYHAYLNSQAPRMASIRAFVLASANLDIANEDLADARAKFDAALDEEDIVAFDGSTIYADDPTLDQLQDRLDLLNDTTVVDPVEAAELEAERQALQSLLDSQAADDLAAAEDKAELAAVGTDDESLRQALLDGANRNRVAQYGEDDYVNDEMMDWAKNVLGVGDEVGKIDEVRETLEIDQQ